MRTVPVVPVLLLFLAHAAAFDEAALLSELAALRGLVERMGLQLSAHAERIAVLEATGGAQASLTAEASEPADMSGRALSGDANVGTHTQISAWGVTTGAVKAAAVVTGASRCVDH
jgi:hypothetical protein